MSLAATYGAGKFGLSFELYPPKTRQGEAALFRHVEELVACQPSFITCTYGAGGSTRTQTLEIIGQVKNKFRLPVASHLTCVGSTVDQLRSYLTQAEQAGVDYIVALRGDPPAGETVFHPPAGSLRYASELVALIKAEFPCFGVAVAGYPETHREAPSPAVDLQNLKHKVDMGADVVITQLFYNNDDFFRFRDRCEAAGIRVPLVPGILPVNNLSQIQRISSHVRRDAAADVCRPVVRQQRPGLAVPGGSGVRHAAGPSVGPAGRARDSFLRAQQVPIDVGGPPGG